MIRKNVVCKGCGKLFDTKFYNQEFCTHRCQKDFYLAGRRKGKAYGRYAMYHNKLTQREREQAILLLLLLKEYAGLYAGRKIDLDFTEMREAWREIGRIKLAVMGD